LRSGGYGVCADSEHTPACPNLKNIVAFGEVAVCDGLTECL